MTVALGGNFWLGDRVSFWPEALAGRLAEPIDAVGSHGRVCERQRDRAFPIGPDTVITEHAAFVQLYAPFLFHLARHFFVGFGPDGYVDLVHSANSIDNRRLFLGASSTIGGWF